MQRRGAIQAGLQNLKPEKEKQLKKFIKNSPVVNYAPRLIGKFDLLVSIKSKDLQDFYGFVDEFRTNFPGIIHSFDSMLVEEQIKISTNQYTEILKKQA